MHLIKGLGVEGDFHQGGDRQVSLLGAEARAWMESQTKKGLCFERFKENMLIEGLSEEALKSGDLLLAGKAVLRISGAGKHCFKECVLFSEGQECLLSESALFAIVEESGYVRSGDYVKPMSGSRFHRFFHTRF